uniref:Uncharacterized protein n=1 Tax=Physcomitrium patens TaxID=3218 RepID=A0A2K1JTI7_PHYPA|nr:hypothetical protein PHYPA_014605 [Physcomitrium patens]
MIPNTHLLVGMYRERKAAGLLQTWRKFFLHHLYCKIMLETGEMACRVGPADASLRLISDPAVISPAVVFGANALNVLTKTNASWELLYHHVLKFER